MAISKITNPVFTPTYTENYTEWMTPEEDVTIDRCTLTQYDDNIYYFYIKASFAQAVNARNRKTIGTVKPEFFGNKNLANYCIAEVHQENSSTPYIAYIAFLTAGTIQLFNGADVAIKDVGCQGTVFRRI